MTLKQTKQRGFTIVELLIVVVIIAILAAITIVAYNGIQNRANTSSAAAAAASVQKKAEAYNVETSSYPTTFATLTTAASDKTYNLPSGAVTLVTTAIATKPSSPNSINYYTCNSAKGFRVTYWDYNTSAPVNINGGDQTAGSCTIATS